MYLPAGTSAVQALRIAPLAPTRPSRTRTAGLPGRAGRRARARPAWRVKRERDRRARARRSPACGEAARRRTGDGAAASGRRRRAAGRTAGRGRASGDEHAPNVGADATSVNRCRRSCGRRGSTGALSAPGPARRAARAGRSSRPVPRSRIRRVAASAGQRAREVVALGEVAAERLEVAPGVLGLDALGDDAQAEVVGEVDRGAHDRGVGGVDGHLDHERLVDLDHVDREPLEVGQRRVAGAEVVDRERQADLAQARRASPPRGPGRS